MTVPKSNQKAVNKYVKNNYDRINVTLPKGKRAEIQSYADAMGMSTNAYIIQAIETRMKQDESFIKGVIPTKQIEDQYRKDLEKLGLKMHKVDGNKEPLFYVYEIGADDTEPGPGEEYRYMTLSELGDYITEEKNNQ